MQAWSGGGEKEGSQPVENLFPKEKNLLLSREGNMDQVDTKPTSPTRLQCRRHLFFPPQAPRQQTAEREREFPGEICPAAKGLAVTQQFKEKDLEPEEVSRSTIQLVPSCSMGEHTTRLTPTSVNFNLCSPEQVVRHLRYSGILV